MNTESHHWFVLASSVLPLAGVAAAMVLLWNSVFSWSDVVALVVMYSICALGVSMGYHRMLTHRSFQTGRPLRVALAAAGAMAGQGPPIIWVAHHRRHHRVADREGDPHSPHLGFPPGLRGVAAGLWHAHLGWLLHRDLASDPIRYAPDLVRERSMRWLSERFVLVVMAGLLLPGLIGFAVGGTPAAFLTGVLWGGLVRLFLVNHTTYAVNSVGHFLGSRRFDTPDLSRNVAWLALPSFGESWHNNHHAFPRSARHGMRWWEIDLTASVIWALERCGLVWKVIRVDPDRLAMREAGRFLVSDDRRLEAVLVVRDTTPPAERDTRTPAALTDVE